MAHKQGHTFAFTRLGGVDQALFRGSADIVELAALDQKLWVALACPIEGVALHKRTLELLDAHHDGRIRASELLDAIDFTRRRLGDADAIAEGSDRLERMSIDPTTAEGAALLLALDRLGRTSITLDEVRGSIAVLAEQPLNGDGVVTPDSAADPALAEVIHDLLSVLPGVPDRSGKSGVDRATLETFFGGLAELARWEAEGPAVPRPFDRTEVAHAAFTAVRSKVEDWFARARLAEFDPRAIAALNRDETELGAIAQSDLGEGESAVARLPLAQVGASPALPLDRVNPAWRARMAELEREVISPLLGARTELAPADWAKIVEALAPYDAYLRGKPEVAAAKLPAERARALASGEARAPLEQLIEADRAQAEEQRALEEIERLITFQRDLRTVVENFVSFIDFYHPQKLATFQAGRLLMDARATQLCIPVADVAKHAALATGSKIYLAYCELERKATNQKRTICAGFTSGVGRTLFVGRNGIFYDREGNDWDATITKVVEAPVSLREAFWSPWRKTGAMIGQQIDKLLESREAAAQAGAAQKITAAQETGKPSPTPAAGAAVASSVAAIGIALGFLSTAVASLLGYLTGFPLWKTLLGLVGVFFLVSGPSVAIAYFKLRQRDLAPVLNASGWAINGRILLNRKLGAKLTERAALPKGAERRFSDPYRDSRTTKVFVILALLLVAALAALQLTGLLAQLLAQLAPPAGP